MVSFILWLLYMWGKFPCYTLDSLLGGPKPHLDALCHSGNTLIEWLTSLKPTHYTNLISTPLMNTELFLSTIYILLELGLMAAGYTVTVWHMWTYCYIVYTAFNPIIAQLKTIICHFTVCLLHVSALAWWITLQAYCTQ
jgi:hypothetical protein